MNYYLYINGQSVGPMTEHQIFAYPVDQNTNVSTDGVNWRPLYTYPELMEDMRKNGGPSNKSEVSNTKLLCGIFAIILGGLGIQYFILGKVWGGIITIGLTLITCGLWEIVTVVQGILMLCMSDEVFKTKYIDNPNIFPLF